MTRTTLLSVLLLAACGKQIDPDKVAESITKGLAEKKLTAKNVSCPSGKKAKAGDTFQCTATDDAGTSLTIDVTQQDDQGTVQWKLDGQILDTEAVVADAKGKIPGAAITCPRKAVVIKGDGNYECAIKGAAQTKLVIKVQAGSVAWEAN